MYVSTPVLYELVFIAALLLMVAISAGVVGGLRFLFRGWGSRLRKTLLVHAANLPAIMLAFPLAVRMLPFDEYLGITHGGLISFWLACLIADSVRVGSPQSAKTAGRPGRWRTVAVLAILVVGGAALTRVTALSADGKHALESMRVGYWVVAQWRQRSPEREIVAAMSTNFWPEFDAMMDRYLARAMAEPTGSDGRRVLPRFPYGEVQEFLRQRRPDLARAPDAELIKLARTLPAMGVMFANEKLSCDPLNATVSMDAEYAAQSADAATVQALGGYLIAALDAARAGIDSPTKRTFTAKRTAELADRYAREVPESTGASSSALVAGPEACATIWRQLSWIGGLPPEDAVYALAWVYSSEFDGR